MIYTVWGAGAIGGTVGAHLEASGQVVRFVDIDPDHVWAIRERGLTVEGFRETLNVRAPAYMPQEVPLPLGTVLLAVPADRTEAAIGAIGERLQGDDAVVSLQSGLAERLIVEAIGAGRTVGAFVNFLADRVESGRIHYGRSGQIRVGELDGKITTRVNRIISDLEPMGDVRASRNIWGYLWGRLGYTNMLFATALLDAPAADTVDHHRELMVELLAEIYAVARAIDVHPEPFDAIDPTLYGPPGHRDPDRIRHNLDQVVAWMYRNERTRSDPWRDLIVRKRRTEVDVQIAMASEIGRENRVATPLTDAIVQMIREIEDGARPVDAANLKRLEGLRSQMAKVE